MAARQNENEGGCPYRVHVFNTCYGFQFIFAHKLPPNATASITRARLVHEIVLFSDPLLSFLGTPRAPAASRCDRFECSARESIILPFLGNREETELGPLGRP